MSPTGMSIFFSPVSYNAMIYMQAMNEMLEAAEDEGVKEMLKALETVSLRFLLTTAELEAYSYKNPGYDDPLTYEWDKSKYPETP